MRTFKDDRSRSYNDVCPLVDKGDINATVLYPGTIKAFHRHAKQDDYWFVLRGNIRAVLVTEALKPVRHVALPMSDKPGWYSYDGHVSNNPFTITESLPDNTTEVHYLGEGDRLHIPKNVWHGLQVLGNEEAIMIYHITEKYNPRVPDEERAPWDKFYSWEISRK